MSDDPIVEEVRRIRREHAARFDFDLQAIFADLKRSEAEREAERSPLLPPSDEEPMAPPVQRVRFVRRGATGR